MLLMPDSVAALRWCGNTTVLARQSVNRHPTLSLIECWLGGCVEPSSCAPRHMLQRKPTRIELKSEDKDEVGSIALPGCAGASPN